jgi:hypothetical protein
MQNKTVREDQAQFFLGQLDGAYKAYAKIPQKPYLQAEDKAELWQALEVATKQAQSALAIMDAQPGMSPVLQGLKSKLILWSTLAEADLKTT